MSPRRSTQIIQLILLVSCAHALVHLLEQSVASVEQVICRQYALHLTDSGWLGMALRLPYGLGSFAAGLLADRFGAKRMLVLYLLGSATIAVSFQFSPGPAVVYAQLFGIGAFCSIYHPAGLALLANQTSIAERPRALGMHGVFGSLGIASAPFIAGFMLTLKPGDWQLYYLVLGLTAATLGLLIWLLLKPLPEPVFSDLRMETTQDSTDDRHKHGDASPVPFRRIPFALLVTGTALSGIVYGGVLHFLPRYLKDSGVVEQLIGANVADRAALGNYAAALALICGAAGQWTAGRLAIPDKLPLLLSAVFAANVPFLIWMANAQGHSRLVAACLWAFFHFMNQPIYNSLLPAFLPRHRRSAGFGFSNMMGFGVGALGPPLVAQFDKRFENYSFSYYALAVLAIVAALMPLLLRRRLSIEALPPGS